ncbi:MAG: hypothetical protein AAFN41_05115 [Planctomycetota bacterium]
MSDRSRIEIASRPATPEERASAAVWLRALGADQADERFGCVVVLMALPVLAFGLTPWSTGWLVPVVILVLVFCVPGILLLVRKRRVAVISQDDVAARTVSLSAIVLAAWPVAANESREADVLLELAPGVQVFGLLSCARKHKPEIAGEIPSRHIVLEWTVVDHCPAVKAAGEARLAAARLSGDPVKIGTELSWSAVSTRAYDISIYEESVDPAELGRYPTPTAIELFADLASAAGGQHVDFVDHRPVSDRSA